MKTSPEGVKALDKALRNSAGTSSSSVVGALEKLGFMVSPIPATVEAGVVERALEAYEAIVFTAHASRRKREAMRAALEAAGLLPFTPAWRGIETAPRDGTWIIVYLASWKWPASKMSIVQWLSTPDGVGWHDDETDDGPTTSPVTHWMPLPSSPVSGGEEEA